MKKLLLIGWDAADWKIAGPLMDQGKMPNLKSLVERGVMGNLATLQPPLSPMMWTSIATGKRPYKHGIHGFTEPDPGGRGVRPITSLSRNTRALWNMLQLEGLRCNVVGWWPSHPAEPIDGVMVSNHYQTHVADLGESWPLRPGTVHPERLIEPLSQLRVHPQELEGDMLRAFVPDAETIDQEKDQRLYGVAKILAETASIQAAATAIMQLEPWDFIAVYFDGIDHFGHGYMKYHPPRQPWIPEADYALYKGVVEGGYCFHDAMLGAMLALIDDDTAVMLVSDHGFHPDRLRPRRIPNEPAGPAEEHRPFGVVAAAGPGFKRDQLVFGASLLDIAPTILHWYGLPVGRDMDGRPLLSMLEDPGTPALIDSWDQRDGDDGGHPADFRLDPVDARASLEQLAELGYIERPDTDLNEAVRATVRELRYNLARSYLDAARPADALPILEELWHDWPDESRFGVQFVEQGGILLDQGKARDAAAAYEQALELEPENAAAHLGRARALLAQQDNQGALLAALASIGLIYHNARAHGLCGEALLLLGRDDEALSALDTAIAQNPVFPHAHELLADLHARGVGGRAPDAERTRQHRELAKAARTRIREQRATGRPAKDAGRLTGAQWSEEVLKDLAEPAPAPAPLDESLVVVSGLPRSGTSMMMQMLSAGGLGLVTDTERAPDPDNPRGYFELEAVKRLHLGEHDWCEAARGKAVKVVAPLLQALPSDYPLRILFMDRALSEVVASQAAMLERQGKRPADAETLARGYRKQLDGLAALLDKHPRARVLRVSHRDTLDDPLKTAIRVADFLGGGLDVTAMTQAVTPDLHRQRRPVAGSPRRGKYSVSPYPYQTRNQIPPA